LSRRCGFYFRQRDRGPPYLPPGGTGVGLGGTGSGGGFGDGGIGVGFGNGVGIGSSEICSFLIRSHLLEEFSVNLKDAGETAREFAVFLVTEFAFLRQPFQMARRIRVVRIVNEIMIGSVGRARARMFINENGVIDVENREIRQISDEEFVTRERLLEQGLGLHLIIFIVEIKHSHISWAQIDNPANADVSLHQSRIRRAELAQIAITGNDDPLFRREGVVPR